MVFPNGRIPTIVSSDCFQPLSREKKNFHQSFPLFFFQPTAHFVATDLSPKHRSRWCMYSNHRSESLKIQPWFRVVFLSNHRFGRVEALPRCHMPCHTHAIKRYNVVPHAIKRYRLPMSHATKRQKRLVTRQKTV